MGICEGVSIAVINRSTSRLVETFPGLAEPGRKEVSRNANGRPVLLIVMSKELDDFRLVR